MKDPVYIDLRYFSGSGIMRITPRRLVIVKVDVLRVHTKGTHESS